MLRLQPLTRPTPLPAEPIRVLRPSARLGRAEWPALERACELAGQGGRVLLTCVDRRREALWRQAVDQHPRLDIWHYHRLCFELAGRARLLPLAAEDAATFYAELLPQALAEAARRLPLRYDAIVVDQAGQFLDGWWPPLRALLADGRAVPLIVFGRDESALALP